MSRPSEGGSFSGIDPDRAAALATALDVTGAALRTHGAALTELLDRWHGHAGAVPVSAGECMWTQ